MATNQTKIYASDLAFVPSLDNGGDLAMVTNEASINQAIFNIIKTRQGSRVMTPNFGAGIDTFLFEPLSQDTGTKIGTTINGQLQLWEPRIQILSTQIEVFETPSAGYNISITYIILSTLTTGNFSTFLNKQSL